MKIVEMKNGIEHRTGHVYTFSPIDYDWEFMPKLADYLLQAEDDATNLLSLYTAAKQCALYNEVGNDRQEPRVMFLPNTCTNWRLAIVWKKNNNGTPHLRGPAQHPRPPALSYTAAGTLPQSC